MGMGHWVAYGDRGTGRFGEGATENPYLLLTLGKKSVWIPFASPHHSVTCLLLTCSPCNNLFT